MCEGCKKVSTTIVNSENLEFDDLDIPDLPVVVPLSDGKEYEFKPITVRQYFDLVKLGEQNNTMAMLAMSCENEDFDIALKKFFNVTNVEDAEMLQEVDKMLYHGVKDVENICKNKKYNEDGTEVKCMRKTMLELDGGRALLLPFRERKESPRDRIRFGSKGDS